MLNPIAVVYMMWATACAAGAEQAGSPADKACDAGNSVVPLFCRDGVCLPRLFILGAAKSSTTSLWSLMRWQFGNVCSPVALEGDPKWFRYNTRLLSTIYVDMS